VKMSSVSCGPPSRGRCESAARSVPTQVVSLSPCKGASVFLGALRKVNVSSQH